MVGHVGSSLMVLNSNFTNNTASTSGGVLYIETQSNSTVYSSIFTKTKQDIMEELL